MEWRKPQRYQTGESVTAEIPTEHHIQKRRHLAEWLSRQLYGISVTAGRFNCNFGRQTGRFGFISQERLVALFELEYP
jgi:hypothetical protein